MDSKISIHAPAWGATLGRPHDKGRTEYFNPRSRVGSDKNSPVATPSSSNFNPRSRVGSDTKKHCFVRLLDISIHAPAWGATALAQASSARLPFQSTLPRGERHYAQMSIQGYVDISIHAPAWGATRTHARRRARNNDFNPRSRVGSDVTALCKY